MDEETCSIFVEEQEEKTGCDDLHNLMSSPAKSHAINPYHVLNVRSDASQDEIQMAYRKLALLHHPYRNRTSNGSREDHVASFVLLNASYETLMDPHTKSRYDSMVSPTALTDSICKASPLLSSFTNPSQLHKRDYHDGPLTDLYRARQYAPFRDPYQLFDDVFQCQLFTETTRPTPPSPQLSIVVSTPSFSSTSDIPTDAEKEDHDFFNFMSCHILHNLCLCSLPTSTLQEKGCTSEEDMSSMIILHPPPTTSTYLFCPDYYKCRKWIGTSIMSPDETRHICQISKIDPDRKKCITRTEITTQTNDGTYQTRISVGSAEQHHLDILRADSGTCRDALLPTVSSETHKRRRRRAKKKTVDIEQKPSLSALFWKSNSCYPYCDSYCHS
jgi:hypothetical protein